MKDVIGFGALNADLFFRRGGWMVDEVRSSVPFDELLQLLGVEAELITRSGGGSAANTIYALAKMDFKTAYIGRIGTDENGEFLLHELQSVGVDTSGIQKGNGKTGVCISLLEPGGERKLLIFPNENERVGLGDLATAEMHSTQFLHLSSFTGAGSLDVQKSVVAGMPPSVRITFDPGEIYAHRGMESLRPLIERSYLLFVTKREIEILTALEYGAGAQQLMRYAKGVICKLGKNGTHVFWQGEDFYVPSFETNPVDTTGAGDVYAAGFIAGLLLAQSVRRCAWSATKLACQSILGYGRENYPDREDLERALNEDF